VENHHVEAQLQEWMIRLLLLGLRAYYQVKLSEEKLNQGEDREQSLASTARILSV
jgi:hypothetical protein